MLPEKIREIIEEDRFKEELRHIISDARRADEFLDGARWVLSRDPMSGSRIGPTAVWFFPMEEIPNILPVVLYYTFDHDYVNFLSIQETLYAPQ